MQGRSLIRFRDMPQMRPKS